MKSRDFVNKARKIATEYTTLYIMGCFGSPMSQRNKIRYTNNHPYNQRPERRNKIMNAGRTTYGFDCVCLIKGILWGWYGNPNLTYGGAVYLSNGVPDVGADQIMNYCTGVSSDFSNIIPGEIVHMPGHVGIYIGDGLAVECTPIWKDGVQITAVRNMGYKEGFRNRTWSNHGKLNFVDYSTPEPPKPDPKPPVMKFKIGDKVIATGKIYSNSNAENPANTVNGLVTNITRVNPGSKHPYNTTGDLGWMDEDSLKLYEEPSKPTLNVNDNVEIIGTGNGASDGSQNVAYGIGYKRRILAIYNGRAYPYQVGNDYGTTGFYKEDSLRKL